MQHFVLIPDGFYYYHHCYYYHLFIAVITIIVLHNYIKTKQVVANTRQLAHTQKQRWKTFFTIFKNLKNYNPLNKASLCYVGLAEYARRLQVSIVLFIGSRMSEILAVSVHSGWDGGNMDNARSPKNRFRKQKNLNSKPSVPNADP